MFLGIDQSLTCTGLVVLNEGDEITGHAYPNRWSDRCPAGGGARLSYYRRVIVAVCKKHKIRAAAWESYAFSKREGSRSFAIGELGGVILQVLDELSIRVVYVTPGQVKKWAGHKTPREIMVGKGVCRCGGQIIHPRERGKPLGGSKRSAPKKKDLEKEWVCRDCEKPYNEKDAVMRFVDDSYGEPWQPLQFSGISERAKAKLRSATDKTLSDLADATVLAAIARAYFLDVDRGFLESRQSTIIELLEEA